MESCFLFLTLLNMQPLCIHPIRFSQKILNQILESYPRWLSYTFFFLISYNYNIDYTRWIPYSACNATCGNGTKSRFRVCIDDDPAICTYNQKYFDYEDCNEGDCPGLLHARKKMKCLV